MSAPDERPQPGPPPQRGDEDVLYRRYGDRLRRIVRSRVNTSEAAIEDACSFAWLQLLRQQPERERLLGWLVTTATREAIALDRRARRSFALVRRESRNGEEFEVEPASPRDEMGEAIEYRSALSDVAAAHLTDRQKQAIALLAAGHTHKEIAVITGWTLRVVERQIQRGREKLVIAREVRAPDHASTPVLPPTRQERDALGIDL